MKKKIKSNTLYRISTLVKGPGGEETETRRYKYSYSEYTEDGQMLVDIRYNEDGEVEEKYVNKYDSSGRLSEELTYLTEDEIAEHKSYERDEKGQIFRAFKHYQDGEKDTIHYTRDEAGNLVEKVTIDSYNEEEARETIEYKENKITHRSVFEYDELTLEESFTYDPDGNMSGHTKWSTEDEDSRFVSEFDTSGNLVRAMRYSMKDELLSRVVYTYEGNLLTLIVDESTTGKNTTTLKYDAKGNLTEQVEVNKNGQINNQANRKYNENGEVSESEVFINYHGRGVNQHYVLEYAYEYYD